MRTALAVLLIVGVGLTVIVLPAAAQPAKKDTGKEAQPAAAAAESLRFIPMLAAPDVLTDLKLPAETVRKISALFAQREDAIRTAMRGGGAGREKAERVRSAATEVDAKIAALVTPEQRLRLRQIYLQARGGEAFVEPDIAAELKLDGPQRQVLSGIMQEMALAKGKYAHEFRGQVNFTDKAESRARAEFLPKFVAALNADQRKTWESLTGPRFAGEVPLSALVLSARRPQAPPDRKAP